MASRLFPTNPRLPPELENIIFEFVALSHPTNIPQIMLVASRVKNWWWSLFLYRTVLLCTRRSRRILRSLQIPSFPACPVDVLLRLIKTKPPAFLQQSVKHLFLDESVFALEAETVQTVLSSCTQAVNVFASCLTSTQALDPLARFQRLRRLTIDVHDFISVCVIDGTALPDTLTHLHLLNTTSYFQYTGDPYVPALTAHISSLKHLTHIAFDSAPPNALYAKLCSRWRTQCVVCLNLEACEIDAVAPLAEEDDRFVCIEQNVPFREDWLRGTDGARDFWALAEAFIAARRAGKVDSDEYSIVDDADDSWSI
ncbi:hypothetical protein MVEN_00166200 [Mycena venus]|uniref:Uncharacterized protein n=1 Tax=Mycena venus TaxID=2733690 RepID=A0A8H6Z074_9AGAR|nr:hypothetical protein MVEN_00166200 [Mycena venus]